MSESVIVLHSTSSVEGAASTKCETECQTEEAVLTCIQDSSDSAVVRLQTGHPGNCVSPSSRTGDFALLRNIQSRSVAHHAFSSLGIGGAFHTVILVGPGADCSPPSSVNVNNSWSYTSTPSYAFLQCMRTTFTFIFTL